MAITDHLWRSFIENAVAVISYTEHSFTAAFSESSGGLRFGANSWATKPVKPVALIALMMAG